MPQADLKSRPAPHVWPFQVRPLHPVLGCEITGITLAEAVSPAIFAKIYEAFLTYQLILFHDVDLPPATQVAFARNFGEVQVHVLSQYHGYKDHPEIYMLSNLDKDGKPSGKHPDKGTLFWHTDGSWRERTGQATMMYSEIVPQVGGETEFADMYSAYEQLPAAMKSRIEGRRAVHNLDFSRTRRHGEDLLTAEQRAEVPPIAHPIVRTHPDTGRRAIFLGDHAESIEGMEYEDGRALIEELNSMITLAGARLYPHLEPAPVHGVGQPLHAASCSRLRRGAIQAGDAPLHDQRRPAVLRPARSVSTLSAELMRYLVWGGVIAIGALLSVLDRRWIRRPLFAVLLVAGVIGGLIITRVSPFTFGGGDHYMEGVILSAGSALALAGYALAVVWRFVRAFWPAENRS